MVQPESKPIFFTSKYQETIDWKDKVSFSDEILLISFAPNGRSMPNSPFGSFYVTQPLSFDEFQRKVDEIESRFRSMNVPELMIIHPPSYYKDFVNPEWLQDTGFINQYGEFNQAIDLNGPVELHKMQVRKLEKLSTSEWNIEKIEFADFKKLHDFISMCRRYQNLVINIEWEKLNLLKNTFPEQYEGWVIKKDNEWASALITVRVSSEVMYYYLPATLPRFKKDSPMVALLDHVTKSARKLGFKFLDLGISSLNGEKQAGLYVFKERMGAKEFERITFTKRLY